MCRLLEWDKVEVTYLRKSVALLATLFWLIAAPQQEYQQKPNSKKVNLSYSCILSLKTSINSIVQSSSSLTSRAIESSKDSPSSNFPPGNSQRLGRDILVDLKAHNAPLF